MGLLTINHFGFQARKDPNNPNLIQFRPVPQIGQAELMNRGVILQIQIGIDSITANYLQTQNQTIPQPIQCSALVDTGASSICIDSSIVNKLNLSRRGKATSLTANGPRSCNLYVVSISFPGSTLNKYDVIRAVDTNLSQQPFNCLIGRDIMSRWHVHYNGQNGTISIAD